jgi:hypothetical protein
MNAEEDDDLYLLVGIFGGFAEGFVDPKMYVSGNAAVTAANVVANSALVRMGVVEPQAAGKVAHSAACTGMNGAGGTR